MKIKTDAGTITRTVLTLLAFINAALEMSGYSPLPVDNDGVATVISLVFLGITTVISWWKNNSFTTNAKIAQQIKKGLDSGTVPFKSATDLAKKVD